MPPNGLCFPPAKRRVNPMVQQGDEGLLPFPGKLSSNQKPACRLYALHTGCRRVFVRKQGPQNGCLHPMTERSRAASGVLRLKSRRPAASLIGSGSLRRPQRRSLRGGNPHSAGNHRRRPAFPSPPRFLQPVSIAPLTHPVQNGNQGFSPLCQTVFHLWGNLRIFLSMDQLVCLQLLQSRAQGLIGDFSDILFHFIETDNAEFHQRIENGHLVFAVDQRKRVAESGCSKAFIGNAPPAHVILSFW